MSLECSAMQTPGCTSSNLTTRKEKEEGQKEAESEEMRWGGFKEALQRQQEVVVGVGGAAD